MHQKFHIDPLSNVWPLPQTSSNVWSLDLTLDGGHTFCGSKCRTVWICLPISQHISIRGYLENCYYSNTHSYKTDQSWYIWLHTFYYYTLLIINKLKDQFRDKVCSNSLSVCLLCWNKPDLRRHKTSLACGTTKSQFIVEKCFCFVYTINK